MKRKGVDIGAFQGRIGPGLFAVAAAAVAAMYVHDCPNVGPLHWTTHGLSPVCVASVGRLADGRAIRLRAYGYCLRGRGVSNSHGGAVVVKSAGPNSAVLATPFGKGPQGSDVFTYPAGFTDSFRLTLATSTDPGHTGKAGNAGKAAR